MVQIKEFRIVMPISLEEYQIAQMYMVMKMQQQSTTTTEGVEVLENRPWRMMYLESVNTHPKFIGCKGDLFSRIEQSEIQEDGAVLNKIYVSQLKAPTWLTAFAPADALIMQEEAWNAYPRCKTVIKCPYFTKFSLTVETIHRADKGQSENVHGLSKEQLAVRQVEYIDIASAATDYWSYAIGSNSTDFSKFKSLRTSRGPLLDGWQDRCKPVMTAYKLVTIDAPYWGFGYRLEQALLAGERALFLESHRNCFGWIDEWFGMSMQQIRGLEVQNNSSLNKKIGLTNSEGFDQRLCLDDKDTESNRFQLKPEKHELAVDT